MIGAGVLLLVISAFAAYQHHQDMQIKLVELQRTQLESNARRTSKQLIDPDFISDVGMAGAEASDASFSPPPAPPQPAAAAKRVAPNLAAKAAAAAAAPPAVKSSGLTGLSAADLVGGEGGGVIKGLLNFGPEANIFNPQNDEEMANVLEQELSDPLNKYNLASKDPALDYVDPDLKREQLQDLLEAGIRIPRLIFNYNDSNAAKAERLQLILNEYESEGKPEAMARLQAQLVERRLADKKSRATYMRNRSIVHIRQLLKLALAEKERLQLQEAAAARQLAAQESLERGKKEREAQLQMRRQQLEAMEAEQKRLKALAEAMKAKKAEKMQSEEEERRVMAEQLRAMRAEMRQKHEEEARQEAERLKALQRDQKERDRLVREQLRQSLQDAQSKGADGDD